MVLCRAHIKQHGGPKTGYKKTSSDFFFFFCIIQVLITDSKLHHTCNYYSLQLVLSPHDAFYTQNDTLDAKYIQ